MDFSLTASNHSISNEDSERTDLLRNESTSSASHQSNQKLE